MSINSPLINMFWKKKEPENQEIVCKGCGAEITEENAVLDTKTGSFVCKDCQRVGYETDKMTNEGVESKDEKTEQQTIQTETTKEEKLNLTCPKCTFIISYPKSKGKPGSCGYCGERL
ncbi:hypothetical protein HOC35_01430 [Candidatus Woesearchaeota archaeon]|jgi:hypothetical protein|nr:hypothetical protein [Candidatus Woesearchaeota archaeon]